MFQDSVAAWAKYLSLMRIQAKASEEPSKTLSTLTALVDFCTWNDGSHFFYRSNLFIWVLQKQKASTVSFWLHTGSVLPVLLSPVPVLAPVLLPAWELRLCLCPQLAMDGTAPESTSADCLVQHCNLVFHEELHSPCPSLIIMYLYFLWGILGKQ